MASERTDELYKILLSKGYPKELCAEIAYKNMNTDYTATRMLGYLYRISNPRIEDLIDEMLAILSDRNAIIQKKELEQAEAVLKEHSEALSAARKQFAGELVEKIADGLRELNFLDVQFEMEFRRLDHFTAGAGIPDFHESGRTGSAARYGGVRR